ncbi:uncharacterized protein KY384_003256 [Bacidia gigantensis]|uniref:uncharacterized protein n=1 Tax=Bacidia gigantensis TaxID=2732470 RepID=UPI001D0539EB|nr:uncharacterized protein KY384_003256 [Bacidia gigantensis]KAG8531625.1 hypothetical protein KY384_003256 [Bacidia gigantensis]
MIGFLNRLFSSDSSTPQSQTTNEAQILAHDRSVLPVSNDNEPSSVLSLGGTDSHPTELDGQADVDSVDEPPPVLAPQPSLRPSQLPATPPSFSGDDGGLHNDSTNSTIETIRSLETQLEQAKRYHRSAQKDLEQKNRRIAELEGEAQVAHDHQVQAIENDRSAEVGKWERKYSMLREVLGRSEEEKKRLKEVLRELEANEDKLYRELRRARGDLDGQRERERVIETRPGMAKNDIARQGNAALGLINHQHRDLERESNITTVPDPQTTERQLRSHDERQHRRGGANEYRLATITDHRGDFSRRHFITRPTTRKRTFLFGG